MRIAYQGAPGAFGHEACLAFAADYEPLAQAAFLDVVCAVADGTAERGILPVENSSTGQVPGIADLLSDARIELLITRTLPVRMHLLALPGVAAADVRTVVSHPVALAQCRTKLRILGLATEEASNTALAAASISQRDRGVLASEAAARCYGLDIVLRDLHDDPNNVTTFTIFARRRVP